MKRYLLAFAGVLALALTTPAFAQAHGGHGFGGGHAMQVPHGFNGPAVRPNGGFQGYNPGVAARQPYVNRNPVNTGNYGYRPQPPVNRNPYGNGYGNYGYRPQPPVNRNPYGNGYGNNGYRPQPPVNRNPYGNGYGNNGYGRGDYGRNGYGHGDWDRGRDWDHGRGGWERGRGYPDRGWDHDRDFGRRFDNDWYYRNNWRFLYWGPAYGYFGPCYYGPGFRVGIFGSYGYPYPYIFPQYYQGAYAYPNPPMGWSVYVDFNGITVVAYWDPYLGGYYYYDATPGGYGYVQVY